MRLEIALLWMALSLPAHAAAPQREPAHSLRVGAVEVTPLNDGVSQWPDMDIATNLPAAERDALLAGAAPPYPFATQAFLVNTGQQLVLIDAGLGPKQTLGLVPAQLQAAGYRAEELDAVLLTHLHPDHVGGLVDGEQARYTNATVHVHRLELADWERRAAAGEAQARWVMARLQPYRSNGRLKTFDDGQRFGPELHAELAAGHTAGHSFFVLQSQGQKLVFWGDLVINTALQLTRPDLLLDLEHDTAAMRGVRQRAYARAAREQHWVAGAHIAFPGIGRLRAKGSGYEWLPLAP